jgi:hypothetical protein
MDIGDGIAFRCGPYRADADTYAESTHPIGGTKTFGYTVYVAPTNLVYV